MDTNVTRRNLVRQLFVDQHPEPRTGNDVFTFYGWLYQNRRELLPPTKGASDPYQHLKSDLNGLWRTDVAASARD